MKFRSAEDGFITALRFYKQPNNTGTHVGHLWTSRRPAARRGRRSPTRPPPAGRRSRCPARSQITKDTTYVTSYHSTAGRFALQPRLLRLRRQPGAAARADRRRSRRQRRLPVRRQRASRTRPSAPPTTGSTPSSSATRPADTRAAAGQRSSPAADATRRRRRLARSTVTFDEPHRPPDRQHRLDRAQGRATARPSPARSPTTTATRTATLTPPAPLAARPDLHGDGQERHRRRHRPRRQPAGGRPDLVVLDPRRSARARSSRDATRPAGRPRCATSRSRWA